VQLTERTLEEITIERALRVRPLSAASVHQVAGGGVFVRLSESKQHLVERVTQGERDP
jgi:hypothetical protein